MTTYLARSAWTSTSAAGATLTGSELVGVAVHWPGTTQAAIGDPGQAAMASRLRSYRTFHVNTRGWSDIGYNFAIDQGGRVWMLRSTQWKGNRVGAHCASSTNPRANHKYVGVLLVIGQFETPSAKMVAAFQDWYHNRFRPGWPGRSDVRPHKRVPGALTNCCGTRATALIDNGTLTAKPSSGGGTAPPPPPPEEDQLPSVKEVWEDYRINGGDFDGQQPIAALSTAASVPVTIRNESRQREAAILANQAKQLTELAAIRAAVNGDPVDEGNLAHQLAPLLAPVLVPAVVAELSKFAGVTAEQAEEINERVLRRVLGSLSES